MMYILKNNFNEILEIALTESECVSRFKKVMIQEYTDWIDNNSILDNDGKSVRRITSLDECKDESEKENVINIYNIAHRISELVHVDKLEDMQQDFEEKGWEVVKGFATLDYKITNATI